MTLQEIVTATDQLRSELVLALGDAHQNNNDELAHKLAHALTTSFYLLTLLQEALKKETQE